jgi:hypothetical protein
MAPGDSGRQNDPRSHGPHGSVREMLGPEARRAGRAGALRRTWPRECLRWCSLDSPAFRIAQRTPKGFLSGKPAPFPPRNIAAVLILHCVCIVLGPWLHLAPAWCPVAPFVSDCRWRRVRAPRFLGGRQGDRSRARFLLDGPALGIRLSAFGTTAAEARRLELRPESRKPRAESPQSSYGATFFQPAPWMLVGKSVTKSDLPRSFSQTSPSVLCR